MTIDEYIDMMTSFVIAIAEMDCRRVDTRGLRETFNRHWTTLEELTQS